MSGDFALIEERRRALGFTRNAIEKAAALSAGHYYKIANAGLEARVSTVARIKLALARLAKNPDAEGGEQLCVDVAYRFAVAFFAERDGFPAEEVHRHDAARRATGSAEWMRAARIRRMAIYALNQFAGISQVKLARAAGMTKGAVCMALKEIEDSRDAKGLDEALERLEAAITGGWR